MPLDPHFLLDTMIDDLICKFLVVDSRKPITRLGCKDCSQKQKQYLKMRLLFGSDEDTDSDEDI